MSLNQGPESHLITSVDIAKQALFSLKQSLLAQERHHQGVINQFLTILNLSDIPQIDERYSHHRKELAPLLEQANHYRLIVKGNFSILVHGIESLIWVFENNSASAKLNTLNCSTLLLAKAKLQNENNLLTFSRQHRNIEKDSPEEQTKCMLERTVVDLVDSLKLLSDSERLAIEYYEVVLKAEELFKLVACLEKDLGSLHQKLSALTPVVIDTPLAPAASSWDKLGGDKDLSSEALSAILAARLSLKTPDPSAWDVSAPNSRPTSLDAPLDPHLVKTALHAHAQQAQSQTEQTTVAPGTATLGGAPRPNS